MTSEGTMAGELRQLLMGCGSIGGLIAGHFLRAGHDLHIVTHNPNISRAIDAEGLRCITPAGRFAVPATAHTSLEGVTGLFDVVYLVMKATDVEQAARDVADLLSPTGYVVTLQNGIVEDRVAAILGRERVVGALVGWGATMRAPGLYEMTSKGETVVGELDGRVTPRVEHLKRILDVVTPTAISNNIYGVLWSKLAINCAISTLGAVTGLLLGEMLRHREVRRLALTVVSEVIDVARAHDVVIEPVAGTLDLSRLYLPPSRRDKGFAVDDLFKHVVMLAIGFKFRRLRSSMLHSMERGRQPEIDFLNGYVVARGQEKDVPTPVNTALVTMVREIAAGARTLGMQNLAELIG